MNTTPSRYETIFAFWRVGRCAFTRIRHRRDCERAIRHGAREYGVQKAQPDIYTYVGRPGVEYLVTSEYDEQSGDIYDGKATAEHVESKLFALLKGALRTPEEPEILKKWIGPVTQTEFKG